MTFKEALKLLKPYRGRMAFVMALAVAISAISATTPFVNRNMIDRGLLQGDIGVVARLVLLIILLQVGGQFIEYLQRKVEIEITNDLGKSLKAGAFSHGLKLKPSYYKEHGFYKTISDALYDISNIMMITNNSLLTIFVIICKCAGAIAGLIVLDWRLSIFVAAIIPFKVWINAAVRKRVERHGERLMKDNKEYNSWLSNILAGIVDIKLWNLRKKVVAEYEGHVETINESSKRLSLLNAKNGFFIAGFDYSWMNLLYVLGAALIAKEWLTFGGLIAFCTFAAYVLSPVNIIMDLRLVLKRIAPSVDGLRGFYELEEENYDASMPMAAATETIEFRDVSLALGGRQILKGFNLTVRGGEKVAIVGENGSGKTTMINLLLRLQEPDSGEILMNGVPISEYNIEDYRRRFSVVCQDVHLFKGTVMENIALDGAGDGAAVEAAAGGPGNDGYSAAMSDERLRFCTEAIEGWDEGYGTEIGSEGAKLSGGERQKIALLRALHRKADVLVLDEPTSNYDKESEDGFDDFIRTDDRYRFCFIITHRDGVVAHMDKVVSLDGVKAECN